MIFGDWDFYEDGCEAQAKESLKQSLHKFIDEVCDVDGFWIKKERIKNNPLSRNTIGWKIKIPQLLDFQGKEQGI